MLCIVPFRILSPPALSEAGARPDTLKPAIRTWTSCRWALPKLTGHLSPPSAYAGREPSDTLLPPVAASHHVGRDTMIDSCLRVPFDITPPLLWRGETRPTPLYDLASTVLPDGRNQSSLIDDVITASAPRVRWRPSDTLLPALHTWWTRRAEVPRVGVVSPQDLRPFGERRPSVRHPFTTHRRIAPCRAEGNQSHGTRR